MSIQLTAIIHKLSSLTSNPSYLLTEILDQKTILDHKIILKAETEYHVPWEAFDWPQKMKRLDEKFKYGSPISWFKILNVIKVCKIAIL